MNNNTDFKIGDIVFVGRWASGGGIIAHGPYTIEKEHSGNGNLIVNNVQYRKYGSRASGGYAQHRLYHDTPELREKINEARVKARTRNLVAFLHDHTSRIAANSTLEELEELNAVLERMVDKAKP